MINIMKVGITTGIIGKEDMMRVIMTMTNHVVEVHDKIIRHEIKMVDHSIVVHNDNSVDIRDKRNNRVALNEIIGIKRSNPPAVRVPRRSIIENVKITVNLRHIVANVTIHKVNTRTTTMIIIEYRVRNEYFVFVNQK